MFQAALRPQALKCSVARTLQASEEARVTAAAKLFPGIKRLSERVLVQGLGSRVWDADGNELIGPRRGPRHLRRRREDGRGPARRGRWRRPKATHDGPARGPAWFDDRLELRRRLSISDLARTKYPVLISAVYGLALGSTKNP